MVDYREQGVYGKGEEYQIDWERDFRWEFRSGFIFSFVVMDTHVAFACS